MGSQHYLGHKEQISKSDKVDHLELGRQSRDKSTASVAYNTEEHNIDNRQREEHPEVDSKQSLTIKWVIAITF